MISTMYKVSPLIYKSIIGCILWVVILTSHTGLVSAGVGCSANIFTDNISNVYITGTGWYDPTCINSTINNASIMQKVGEDLLTNFSIINNASASFFYFNGSDGIHTIKLNGSTYISFIGTVIIDGSYQKFTSWDISTGQENTGSRSNYVQITNNGCKNVTIFNTNFTYLGNSTFGDGGVFLQAYNAQNCYANLNNITSYKNYAGIEFFRITADLKNSVIFNSSYMGLQLDSLTKNITVDNIIISDSQIYSVSFTSNSNISIKNSTFNHSHNHNILATNVSNSTFQNNTVTWGGGGLVGKYMGIEFLGILTTNNSIIGNTVHNNSGAGIMLVNGSYSNISDNTVYWNGDDGINFFWDANNNTVTNNTIYDNGKNDYTGGAGIWTDSNVRDNFFDTNYINDYVPFNESNDVVNYDVPDIGAIGSAGNPAYNNTFKNTRTGSKNKIVVNEYNLRTSYNFTWTDNRLLHITNYTNVTVDVLNSSYNKSLVYYPSNVTFTNRRGIADQGIWQHWSTNIIFLNATIVPTNPLNVSVYVWNSTDDYYKKWNESSAISTTTTEHIIGDLPSNQWIYLKIDGAINQTFKTNSSGYVTFNYTGGYSEHQFEMGYLPKRTKKVIISYH